MLANLLEVGEGILLATHDRGHSTDLSKGEGDGCKCDYSPTEGSPLELLAAVHAVTELEQADVVLRHLVDQVSCCPQLSQSKLVVVLVVQHVHQGG